MTEFEKDMLTAEHLSYRLENDIRVCTCCDMDLCEVGEALYEIHMYWNEVDRDTN
jgi:hypothetical protein